MSPRGADSFNKHQANVEQRRADAQAAFGPKADYFGISGGQFAAVRFLEQGQDIAWAAMHRVPVPGRTYPQDVLCLDQEEDGTPCPFCQSEHKGIRARSSKGFYNIIWRGGAGFQAVNSQIVAQNAQRMAANQPQQATYLLAPIYKRNEYGTPEKDQNGNKVILGYQDGVFLWKCSKTVHDELLNIDGQYQGLMSRDFVIRRTGNKVDDTKYYITPLDVNSGAQPMSAEDQQLMANKYNLDEFITPMSYENAVNMLSGGVAPQGPQPTFDRGAGAMPPAGMPPIPGAQANGFQGAADPSQPTPFQHGAPGQMPQQ